MKTPNNNQLINNSGHNSGRNSGTRTQKRQTGVTLIEAMISLALSLIVTSAMVVLMANSMGTSTRIIQMSQLSDELRNAMSMMTRDVRRANYSANSIFCYGNPECGFAGGDAEQAGDIILADRDGNGEDDCFTFNLDRNFDGDTIDDEDGAAGFRRVTNGGIGVIEMWTGGASPNCADGPGADGWIELTDPNTINVMDFVVNDSESKQETVLEGKPTEFENRQRQIDISIRGELVLEQDRGDVVVKRRIEDTIYVRNDYILEPVI
jgi:type II secretory pathway pseudopilin PulG